MPFFKGLLQSSKLSLQSITGIIRVVTNTSCLALFTRSSPSRFRSLALQNSRMTRSPVLFLHILWRNAKYFVEVSRALKKKSLGPLLGLMFSVLGIQKGSPRLSEITLIPSRGKMNPTLDHPQRLVDNFLTCLLAPVKIMSLILTDCY